MIRPTAVWSFACLLLTLGAAGCATTIVDSTGSTVVATAVGQTTVPTVTTAAPADADGQLDEMVQLTLGLGNLIVDGDSKGQLAHVELLWTQAKPGVHRRDSDLEREVEHQLDLIRFAVERKHPADADKAANNLASVVKALHARG